MDISEHYLQRSLQYDMKFSEGGYLNEGNARNVDILSDIT